ncbi:mechanosensitive ion channel family protein [Luteimonas aestuarii]|nr:mechanosensitive ion channel family protein [Luteimonas aestuarii]
MPIVLLRSIAILCAMACLFAAPAGWAKELQDATPAAVATTEAPEVVDVGRQFDTTLDRVRAKLVELVAFSPLLLVAILIVLATSWISGFVARRLHWLRLRTHNPYMDGLIRMIVRSLIVVLGVVLALDLLGATAAVGAVLGSAGVVGLVIGFAFRDIAENYIASVLLSLRKPFNPRDHVRIDAHEGRVVALTSRATLLMTMDGNELRLPNALVFKAVILNFTTNPRRRFEFRISIDASQSIRVSHALALSQIASVEGVLADPGPSWSVAEFTPNGIVLQFFGWVDQRASDMGKVRTEAIRRVKAEFTRAGIEQPRTVQHVRVTRDQPAGADIGATAPEPVHVADADTSVNRDIDEQLAQAQEQMDDGRNLLKPGPTPP